MPQRKIIHVDMDAFFASVEQCDNPSLRGLPIAVGYDGPRGVVATASYEARPYGVHSALPISRAKALCPRLVIVNPRFDRYKEISNIIREIFHQYTDLVEPLSLDEAFLDVSHLPCATTAALEIKRKIWEATSLTASAGVSVNKMLAKIASDYKKPNGLFVVKPGAVENFVAQLPVEKFFGIGPKTAERMHRHGLFTGLDLRNSREDDMVRWFGKYGRDYRLYGYGIDNRPVEPYRERKSVGSEETFLTDISDIDELCGELALIGKETWRRVEKNRFIGRTVVLKVKFADFHTVTRSYSPLIPIDSEETLVNTGINLLRTLLTESQSENPSATTHHPSATSHQAVRLLGLTVTNPIDPAKVIPMLPFAPDDF